MEYSRVHLCVKKLSQYGIILQSYCTNEKGAIFYAPVYLYTHPRNAVCTQSMLTLSSAVLSCAVLVVSVA